MIVNQVVIKHVNLKGDTINPSKSSTNIVKYFHSRENLSSNYLSHVCVES